MTFQLDEILTATCGTLGQRGKRQIFDRVSTDSRNLREGQLFVALRGEKFDGHDFVSQAVAAGASGVVVDRDVEIADTSVTIVRVADTLKSLGDLAAFHRKRFDIPVIAVTGSAGKTTTKEFISAVLAQRYNVLKAAESYNNEIGVPLTLLELDRAHGAVVLEFAMRGAGQIRYLTELADPTFGVITNIGESHLGILGSLEAIARAKGELVETMKPAGVAALNADDPHFGLLASLSRPEVVAYGYLNAADYVAENIRIVWPKARGGAMRPSTHTSPTDPYRDRTTEFVARNSTGSSAMRLPVCGYHFVSNALAAVSVARKLGLEFQEIRKGLQEIELPKMRQQWLRAPRGFTILNDAYNSSPASLRAALAVVKDTPISGQRIAVLGDIKELGDYSEAIHRRLGEALKGYEVDALICLGDYASALAEGARRGGLEPERVFECAGHEEALHRILSIVARGDVVLVKASRAVRLEEVVGGLMSHESSHGGE